MDTAQLPDGLVGTIEHTFGGAVATAYLSGELFRGPLCCTIDY